MRSFPRAFLWGYRMLWEQILARQDLIPQKKVLFPVNVCVRHRKRLHPPSQTFASAIANVCGEKTPVVESLSPLFVR